MADVFISYSRRDEAFVLKLEDTLVANKRSVWRDKKDIALTSEWLKEILSNIEAADAFAFVISPDSVASPNVRTEIDHAIANHKKMLPIFYRPVADDAIPEALNKFQRIEFNDEPQFDSKLAVLLKALDTDLEWTQEHTRLLIRAKEWEREGRDSSFLLRGKDLNEAEQWMAKSADREPKPTTLQSEYLLAGRQSATKRQRTIIGAVTVAFLIAVGLALYALRQERIAKEQTAAAKRNLANALAVNARSGNEGRDVALLTAVAATRVADTWQTRAALIELLLRNRQISRLLYPRDQISNVVTLAVNQDGQIAASTNDGQAEWWDSSGNHRNLEGGQTPALLAFAADRILTLENIVESDSVVLRDGKTVQPLPGSQRLSSDPSSPPSLFVADRNGDTIAFALSESGEAANITVCTRFPQLRCHSVSRPTQPRGIALSGDGALLAIAWNQSDGAHLEVLQTSNLSVLKTFVQQEEQAAAVAAEGGEFLVLFASGRQFKLPAGADADAPPLEIPKAHFATGTITAANGHFAAFSDALEGIGIPDVDSTIIVQDRSLPPNGLLSQIQPSDAGILAVSDKGVAASRNCRPPNGGAIHIDGRALANSDGEITAASFTPGGELFIAAMSDGRLLAWYPENGIVASEGQMTRRLNAVRAPSRNRILLVGGRHIQVVDPHLLKTDGVDLSSEPTAIDMTAAGRIFFAHDQQTFEYDLVNKREISWTIAQEKLPSWADDDDNLADLLAVSRDGAFLATVANMVGEGISPKILLRNLTRPNDPPLLLATDNKPVDAMTIGTTFLAAATGDAIRMWERSTGTPIARAFVARGVVARVELFDDDSSLVVYYKDGSVETVVLALPRMQKIVCEIVNRDLSRDEWRSKLPSIPYEQVCQSILGRQLAQRYPGH